MARASSRRTSAGSTGRTVSWRSWTAPILNSGTAWEVGYAFGTKKPVVVVRTDVRALAGTAGEDNPMLTQSATARIDLPAASTTEVIAAIRDAISRIEVDGR